MNRGKNTNQQQKEMQADKKPSSSKHPIHDFKNAHYQMQKIQEILRIFEMQMNHTELEWLQLCNIARNQQPSCSKELKSDKPVFKDADEINAIPLDLTASINPVETGDSQSDLE